MRPRKKLFTQCTGGNLEMIQSSILELTPQGRVTSSFLRIHLILTKYFFLIFFFFFLHHWLNVRVGEGFSGQGKFSVLPKIPRFPMRGRQHWSWQSWIIHFWSLLFGGGPLHGPIFNQQNLWTPSCALVGAERGFDESGFKGLRAKLDHWSFSEHSKRCLWKILVSFNWLRYPVKC